MRLFALAMLCLFLAGCTLLERERGYPGGNIGFAADRELLARTHDQRIARYLVAMALLSPLMAETAATPLEAKLSAERIDAVYKRLDQLRAASAKCRQDPNTGAFDTSFNCPSDGPPTATAYAFETLSFDVSVSLFNASKQVAENLGIRNRLSEVADATRLNPLSLLETLFNARRIIPVVLKYYATYRDISVLLGASIADGCTDCDNVRQALSGVVTRGAPVRDETGPIRTLYTATFACIESATCKPGWSLDKQEYLALVFYVDRACKKLFSIQQEDEQLEAKHCGTRSAQTAVVSAQSRSQGADAFLGGL